MERHIYIFVIAFFVILIPVALYIILKPMFRQNELLRGVVNYDIYMKKFVFRVDLKKEEFYKQLKMYNINDLLKYCLNDDCSIITFIRYGARNKYKIKIDEFDKFIILRVEQIPLVSKASFLINEFFIKKFDAKPLEYKYYTF